MGIARRDMRLWALAVLLVVVLGVSQLTAWHVQEGAAISTGAAVGRTTYAYLGGLRKFAAAVLWNRIEPLFHAYYSEVPLSEQTYVLPSLYAVTALDPQFVQAYYVASWVVARGADLDDGVELAREGVRRNPDAGLLQTNLTQLLMLRGDPADTDEMERRARLIASDALAWVDEEEHFEGLAVARDVLLRAGDAAAASDVDARLQEMREHGTGLGDHDHDGDGKQDH